MSDIKAASERMIKIQDGYGAMETYFPHVVLSDSTMSYHYQCRCNDLLNRDYGDIARAYLDEHPSDEGNPIDEAWLFRNGFSYRGINGYSILLPPKNRGAAIVELFVDLDQSEKHWDVSVAQGAPDDAYVRDDIVALTSMRLKTIGELRRFLTCLGINGVSQ